MRFSGAHWGSSRNLHSEGCALRCASLHDLTSSRFGCNLVLLINEEAGHTLRARD